MHPSPPAWLDRSAYPFTSRFCAVTDDGARMHYIDEGEGEPIVFSHGTPTWSFEWRHLVRGLSPGARCVAVDHLGFGLSDRPRDGDYSPEAHAERFRAFLDAKDLRRITLVVHDFGGPIALGAALAAPERIARLVVVNSWMWSFDGDPPMKRLARLAGSWPMRLLYRYANFSLRVLVPGAYADKRKLTPHVHAHYLAPFRERWARDRVLFALARALHGSRSFYDGLWRRRQALADIPSLVVWGMKDAALPPRVLDRWRDALPHARIATITDAGHWPHEEAPASVLAALSGCLVGLRPLASRASPATVPTGPAYAPAAHRRASAPKTRLRFDKT